MHDVAIIGGGPGGLVTAARLAARGHDVVVLEDAAVAVPLAPGFEPDEVAPEVSRIRSVL